MFLTSRSSVTYTPSNRENLLHFCFLLRSGSISFYVVKLKRMTAGPLETDQLNRVSRKVGALELASGSTGYFGFVRP